MLARALFAFLVLPGTIAFLVPLMFFRSPGDRFSGLGIVPLVAGSALLTWSVRDFYVVGKGTLAPWAPTQRLVTTGLYRHSRNPIYISVVFVLIGWTLGFQSSSLAFYTLMALLAFHLRVIFFEEPWLAERYGEQWTEYKRQVPRWLRRYRRRRVS